MKKSILAFFVFLSLITIKSNAKTILDKNTTVLGKSWWMYFEDMDDKTKSTRVLENIRFKVQDENTLIDDDNSDGDGTRSSSMVNYVKKAFPNVAENFFINGNSHQNGIIKISDATYMKVCFRGENKMENLVLIKVYSQEEKFVRDLVNNYDKSPNYKILEEKLKIYMAAWDAFYANEKAEQDKKNAENAANYVMPLPSNFKPISNKICLDAVNAYYNKQDNCKIAYCYLGSSKHTRLKTQTEWGIYKEKKWVSGTYDNVITKRSLDLIVVLQYKSKWGTDEYKIDQAQLTEDAAYGVYDGSKYTGKCYISGFLAVGTDIPSKVAFKYKKVSK